MKIKCRLSLISLFLSYIAEIGKSSHLLNTERAVGRFIKIQDQVLESCKGHFMCEVFPYFNSHGLVCLNVVLVCDGVPHCRDGSDEIPSVCNQFKPASKGSYVTVAGAGTMVADNAKYTVQYVDPGTIAAQQHVVVDGSHVPVVLDASNLKGESIVLTPTKGGVLMQQPVHHVAPISVSDVKATKAVDVTGALQPQHHLIPMLPLQNHLGNNYPGQGLVPLYQQMIGTQIGLNSIAPPDASSNKQMFSQFAQYNGMRKNPSANGLGMWFQGTGTHINPSLANYYALSGNPFDGTNNQPAIGEPVIEKHSAIQDAVHAVEAIQATPPGSSYLDAPVIPPPQPLTPDGIIPVPGQEPHLLQEQNFLEEQFHLANELAPSLQTEHFDLPAAGPDVLAVHTVATKPHGLTDPVLIGKKRQGQLLSQEATVWNAPPGVHDLTKGQRYGLSGPFDGGFPTVQAEVSGLNTMEVTEAQNAIHTLEAIR